MNSMTKRRRCAPRTRTTLPYSRLWATGRRPPSTQPWIWLSVASSVGLSVVGVAVAAVAAAEAAVVCLPSLLKPVSD